jgi:hypothetical protein
MAKAMGPFRDSQDPSWLFGPRTDVPNDHPPSYIIGHDNSLLSLLKWSIQIYKGPSWPWSYYVGFTTTYAITTDVVSSNLDQGEVYNIMW